MNWKIFTAACISTIIISFPQNIIGCGPDADPYDYYTSFFYQHLVDAKAYQPFYYTSYNFLYDESEPVETADVLCKEWSSYCGNDVTAEDASRFLIDYGSKDVNNLYYHLEKNQPLNIPDSVKQNRMTNYFMGSKNFEALGYILYAKKTMPLVGASDGWDAPARDTAKMNKLIKNGFQLLNAAKEDFFKLRYTYQILRLAHYAYRYNDVINWYDQYMKFDQSNSVVKNLSTALKAGALFRTGQKKEAAYLFSKVFAAGQEKRVSNYLGFLWSLDRGESRENYLSLCKNNTEKANMLGMFAINGLNSELDAMKEIYKLNPGNEILEVIAVREISKLEEKYLTPVTQKEAGGKSFYFSWNSYTDSAMLADRKDAVALQSFLHQVAGGKAVSNKALFETGAAYTAYMLHDFKSAKELMASAAKLNPGQKVKDQLALTNLLVTISEKPAIDAAFEAQLLPSLQWMKEKAQKEKPAVVGWNQVNDWQKFYRNLMSEVLAKRYHEQNDIYKEALCIGAADYIIQPDGAYWGAGGIDFLRNKLTSTDVEKLYALLDSKQPTAFESYLLKNNVIKKSSVIDFAGTAYLRDYNYEKAITWFNKSTDKKTGNINTDPFIELLYDQEEPLASEAKFSTTKLAFAQEMLRLQKLSETDKANAAKYLYKMALGMYNITYYGHAWQLVQYYRSGSDGYYIPKDATAFQKEYYGCYKAHDYFEKAMNSSSDKNFKARCLFMMAKCAQKNVHRPQYDEFSSNWDKYDEAVKDYYVQFQQSKYFPQLVKEYGNTPFYKEAFNSCSYLRDFVGQSK